MKAEIIRLHNQSKALKEKIYQRNRGGQSAATTAPCLQMKHPRTRWRLAGELSL